MPQPEVITLENGVRIVLETSPHAKSVALGIWLAQGSRHEDPAENGMTHFAEHMLFKGTSGHTWKELSRRMNLLGGQFNASTSLDSVKLYGNVIGRDLTEALELIHSMFFESTFPENEAVREREVILEEIAMYEDMPEDLCNERYTQALLLPHPVGRPVIGTEELVAGYTAEQLRAYWKRSLVPGRVLVSMVGGIEREAAIDLCTGLFGSLTGNETPQSGLEPVAGHHEFALVDRPLEQVNFCLGGVVPPPTLENRYYWAVFDQILGGGQGSRLFDEVRERRGLAYSIGSSLSRMRDSQWMTISGSTRPENAAEALTVCLDEIRRLADDGPTDQELAVAQTQLERSLLLAMELLGVRASINGERELHGLPHLSVEESIARIHATTGEQVRAAAASLVAFGTPALCLVGPLSEAAGIDKLLTHIEAAG